jgi:uncharacterized Zn-binding protein involved in type VI secretion
MMNVFGLVIAMILLVTSSAGAQQPAVRQGDTTSHGGTIVLGTPTVLIGGQPAARMGDLTTCPLSEGPVPHVGGPIVTGSNTVLIGGKPAARSGDQNVESGPPAVMIGGAATVLIGG